MTTKAVEHSPLGKTSSYIAEYDPTLLFPIPRQVKRDEIQVPAVLPFFGVDIWNGFEISWLNLKGKPEVALAEFIFPCTSPHLIESKSFKLYLNSFNNTLIASREAVQDRMQRDLSAAAGAPVAVTLSALTSTAALSIKTAHDEVSLDTLDIVCDTYVTQPDFLQTSKTRVTEAVYSDLLKSNCLVTGQPDWGSV